MLDDGVLSAVAQPTGVLFAKGDERILVPWHFVEYVRLSKVEPKQFQLKDLPPLKSPLAYGESAAAEQLELPFARRAGRA